MIALTLTTEQSVTSEQGPAPVVVRWNDSKVVLNRQFPLALALCPLVVYYILGSQWSSCFPIQVAEGAVHATAKL